MKVNVKDIIKGEIIGLDVKIIDSKNKSNVGIKGKIIDETKSTIVIEKKGERKRVFKNNIMLKIKKNGQAMTIDGKLLSGRPKERIKG